MEPPRPTQTITEQKSLTDAYAQTEPPCVSNAYTETSSFQELKDIWRIEYELSQGKAFQQQKAIWFSYAYKNWDALEQSRAQHKENKKLKARLSYIFDLVQRVLATRKPFFNYAVFLRERLAFLQIKAIRDGRPYQVATPDQFIETFTEAPNNDQNLLCELYLHNEAMPEDRKMNILPLAGDIQIRDFISFLANQLTWKNAFMLATHNEQNCLLWIVLNLRMQPPSLHNINKL